VGQRRGLDLRRPAAAGERRYVLGIEPRSNTVLVGPRARLEVDEVSATGPVWIGRRPGPVLDCAVQLRAHGMVSPATVQVGEDGVVARLHRPQHGVAAGQALVMYADDEVLGSATITAAARASAEA
jgi:tRNA-specific 2-thiouridylase